MSDARTIMGSVYPTERGYEAILWLEHNGTQEDPEVYGTGRAPGEAVIAAAAGVDYSALKREE